tara:strand:+ start:580 stop:747 length:168 start_codon:yes stop_codon:yes gene_type:complete
VKHRGENRAVFSASTRKIPANRPNWGRKPKKTAENRATKNGFLKIAKGNRKRTYE